MCGASTDPPPVVAIVGQSGSGKTTLLERLIPELKRRGYRVGTVKHHRHAVDIDYEGKDSWRHARAGAATVALVSPERVALVKTLPAELTPLELRGQFFQDVDVVLAEGYKGAATLPKIEIFRSQVCDAPICLNDPLLRAVVSDQPIPGIPCFGLDDIRALADFLESQRFFA
jgi:molybdopterin-guanine dinucleotide biosynthesis adapter protein